MSIHPLITLASERQVKQAKGFRGAAAELNGLLLEPMYKAEMAAAPKRQDQGKKYLNQKTIRTPSARQNGKDDKHFCLAAANAAKAGHNLTNLPNGSELLIIDGLVPLRTAAPDKAKGDEDPNKGVEDIGLLGLLPDDRLAIVVVKYLKPDATHSGAGDTPLRLLLSGLAQAAFIDGNQEPIREEVLEATGRTTSTEAPVIILLAAHRYWEICRKREAQKGAGWIRELERLAREIPEQIGNEVFYASLDSDVEADPAWEYTEDGPVLSAPIKTKDSWESTAGRLKPKRKKVANVIEIIEPNMEKAPQSYAISGSFEVGDRITHKTLGDGVCQGSAGDGKIKVLFGEDTKLLVHERTPRA
ncbi:MAG: hypothetical protein ACJAYI_000527 [Myxococcota bacterium]